MRGSVCDQRVLHKPYHGTRRSSPTRLGLAYGNLVELARGLPDDGRVCSSMGSASIPTHDEMSEHGPCQYPNSCCSPSPMVAACAALRELAVPLSGSARLVTAEKGVCSGRRNRFIGLGRRAVWVVLKRKFPFLVDFPKRKSNYFLFDPHRLTTHTACRVIPPAHLGEIGQVEQPAHPGEVVEEPAPQNETRVQQVL